MIDAFSKRHLIKSKEQIEGIRQSGRINSDLLDYIAEFVQPGISTLELDQLIHERTRKHAAIPATLNYDGFPKSCCISINNVICHGIPSKDKLLKEGDIVNIDVSTIYKQYFSDSSRMYSVGTISDERKQLINVTKDCMDKAIDAIRPFTNLKSIAKIIQSHADEHGYSVVKEFGGHGIGLEFHEDPWIGFSTMNPSHGTILQGMVFTIEPMINQGLPDVQQDADGWTVRTKDGSDSAQWEKTIVVTCNGTEVLAW